MTLHLGAGRDYDKRVIENKRARNRERKGDGFTIFAAPYNEIHQGL